MKKTFLLLFLGSLGHAFGQIKDSTLTYRQEADLMMQYLPKAGATTGILYDRVFPFSQLHTMNRPGIPDSSASGHFSQALYELEEATLIENPDRLEKYLHGSMVRYTSEKKLMWGTLNYAFNVVDTLLKTRGDIILGPDSLLHVAAGYTGPLYVQKEIVFSALLADGALQTGEMYDILPPALFTGGGKTERLVSARYRIGTGVWVPVDLQTGATITFALTGKIGLEMEVTLGSGQVHSTTSVTVVTPDPQHCGDEDWMRRESNCPEWAANYPPSCGQSYPIEADIPFTGENEQSVKGKAEVYYLVLCCLLLCTCSKDKLTPLEQLPPISNTGANTFGCLVDGEAVIFTNPKQISYGLIADVDSLGWLPLDSNDMWLVFDNGKHRVNLFLNNPLSNTEWQFNQATQVYPVTIHPNDYIMVDKFISSEGTKGWFHSNDLNSTRPTFSGTFEFECINPRTCQTLKVTDGRLDLDLRDLQ